VVVFPNAKINIGLNVLRKREDGFHDLETCFYPIPWCDALEIQKSKEFAFLQTGLEFASSPNNNLSVKACNLIRGRFDISPVSIHLHKVIPSGAGLGGGSSDAAFTLKLLNKLFDLKVDDESLQEMASQLGSDCAFFIQNKPTLAYEKGDTFKPVSVDLAGYHIVVIYPSLSISSKQAYQLVKPNIPSHSLARILEESRFNDWGKDIKNDFEPSIFQQYPLVGEIKFSLKSLGCSFVSMSGSGSAVYGISESPLKVEEKIFPNSLIWQSKL